MTQTQDITLSGIVKRYGATVALDGLDLTLRPYEILGIAGPNGAGKSTLVRIIAGEETPTAGRITLGGAPWSPLDNWQRVACVHQEPQLFPNLTVAENLMVGREGTTRLRPKMGEADRQVMATLGLTSFAALPLGQCSLAIQQRCEIARAVARQAQVFLFDEPNSALTDDESRALFAQMQRLADAGRIVVLISHRLADLVRVCARVVVVRDGRVRATLTGPDLTEEAIARGLVGDGTVTTPATAGRLTAAAPLVVASGFSHRRAFADIAVTVERGRILALMGMEGSGAREFLRALAGLEPATGRLDWADAPGGVAYVPATRAESLYSQFSVGDNLLARLGRPDIAGPIGALRRPAMRQLAARAVQRFSVKTSGIDQPIRALSGGNQQKVAIAQALLRQPALLLLEEPTRGVDIQSKAEIYGLLRACAAQGNAVMMYCTEALEAFEAADRVQIITAGRLSGILNVVDFSAVADLAAAIVAIENTAKAA